LVEVSGEGKVRNKLRLLTPCKHPNKETARNMIVAYTSGVCSPAEEGDFESHCLSCGECFTTLVIILRLLRFPVGEEEDKTLSTLYTIGREAARVARQELGMEASTSAPPGMEILPLESSFPQSPPGPTHPAGTDGVVISGPTPQFT
jgi:hypothetical protein